MKRFLISLLMLGFAATSAGAASLVKSYAYFTIGGSTLDAIQDQLSEHGPKVESTGSRHPGATRMAFTTRIGYARQPGSCRIATADVTVNVKVTLPRWHHPRNIDPDVRLFWDTLSADIKRHEERHVEIAKNHARMLEDALKTTYRQKDCETAALLAKQITAKVLASHDRAQQEFDRVELVNFESRIVRLLRYRIEKTEGENLPG